MKYTRANINNETLFMLRERLRDDERAAKDLVRDIDDWMRRRDEAALARVLVKLNEGPSHDSSKPV